MKKLIYSTVAAVALSTAAFADDQLSQNVETILETNGLYVDAWALPSEVQAEIFALEGADSSDNTNRTQLIEILETAGYQTMDMSDDTTVFYTGDVDLGSNSLHDHVEIKLAEWGFNVETDDLTDKQVAELFALTQSTDGEPVRDRIEMVLQ